MGLLFSKSVQKYTWDFFIYEIMYNRIRDNCLRDLCLRAFGTNSECANNVRRKEDSYDKGRTEKISRRAVCN